MFLWLFVTDIPVKLYAQCLSISAMEKVFPASIWKVVTTTYCIYCELNLVWTYTAFQRLHLSRKGNSSLRISMLPNGPLFKRGITPTFAA